MDWTNNHRCLKTCGGSTLPTIDCRLSPKTNAAQIVTLTAFENTGSHNFLAGVSSMFSSGDQVCLDNHGGCSLSFTSGVDQSACIIEVNVGSGDGVYDVQTNGCTAIGLGNYDQTCGSGDLAVTATGISLTIENCSSKISITTPSAGAYTVPNSLSGSHSIH